MKSPANRLISTGGNVISDQGEAFGLSGPSTLRNLEQVGRVLKSIVGALGLDFDYGITDRWHYLAQVKRKMIGSPTPSFS